MPSPADRVYTDTHEWMKQDGAEVVVGVTQFAVNALSDVTYVALPPVGKKFSASEVFGEVESVKATSELYLPIAGTVSRVNATVQGDPAILNSDPYEAGWLIAIKTDAADMSAFMTATEYDAKNEL